MSILFKGKEAVGPCVDFIDLNHNGCGHTCIFPLYDTRYSSFKNLFLTQDTMTQQSKSSGRNSKLVIPGLKSF